MRLVPLLLLAACTAADESETDAPPTDYAFTSRDGSGDSSVSYSGQVFRQLLIDDLAAHIDGLTARIDTGWTPAPGDVTAELELYLAFDDSTAGSLPHGFTGHLPAVQTTYSDVSSGKDLYGKLAGNDATGQHKDWSQDFAGWTTERPFTPQSLVDAWVAELDELAVSRAAGNLVTLPDGSVAGSVFLTADGRDLKQLLEKFLRGGIAYSQGADDYLDDDVDGKGLLSDHSALEDGKPYTALEHAWDEGFGYFGATPTYGAWDDAETAADGAVDLDGDGQLDLLSEVAWGHAINAAKRDLGSNTGTDLTGAAFDAFLAGRHLIAQADGPLTDEQLTELRGHRDQALTAWEHTLVANVVHYVNETLVDVHHLGTDDYSAADHAKHWSELKGFALALQFNPHSPLSDEDFAALHDLLGIAPNTVVASKSEAADDLIAARDLLATAYDLDPENLGDDDGLNGW